MYPPKRDYERLETGVEISGVIANVEYDENRTFKGFDGKPNQKLTGIRFVFNFDDYAFPHSTRWMKFSTYEKSALYDKYLKVLIKDIFSNASFDFDSMKGMRVITTWSTNGDFQNLETIKPADKMLEVKFTDVTEDDLADWSK